MKDIQYMQRAMQLALKARGQTSPNPLVGAVIVKNGRIIAEGYHQRCGGEHAEIIALKRAGARARGATLYITLEPCFHFGRTPPCVGAIIHSGVKEVVIGMRDPNPATNGKSIAKLRQTGIRVKVGFLKGEIKKMNEIFIKYITKQMPFVVAKCAQTLDGKIATATGESQWITSVATRQFAKQRRDDFDAIFVGINTVLKDNPRLNAARKSRRLKKIIIDSTLRIPLNAKLFQGINPGDCYIAATQSANLKKMRNLLKRGVNIIICPRDKGGVDLRFFLKELAHREISSILIEGGSTVLGSALKGGLVDKMHIYIAPKIIGDEKALSSIRDLTLVN